MIRQQLTYIGKVLKLGRWELVYFRLLTPIVTMGVFISLCGLQGGVYMKKKIVLSKCQLPIDLFYWLSSYTDSGGDKDGGKWRIPKESG